MIEIRPTQTLAEYHQLEALQEQIWGPLGVVPFHLLLTIAGESGLVLIAYDGERPIGFGYGFLARNQDGNLKIASHQVGIIPQYQGTGIGYKIKLAQRKYALEAGIKHITWTYDPLLSRNAYFNIEKLGCVVSYYYENRYGELGDAQNASLPSDRFRVDWWLDSPRVQERVAHPVIYPPAVGHIPVINEFVDDVPFEGEPDWSAEAVQIAFPGDFREMGHARPALALAWRLHTRELFQEGFRKGYEVTGFVRHSAQNRYIMSRA